jgi:hypothetical protein
MGRITLTKEDIMKVKIVIPGWYQILCKTYEQQQAGTDGSDLHVWQFQIEGDSPYAGVIVRLSASEKFYSNEVVEFLEVAGQLKPGVPIEADKLVGTHLEGYIQRGEYKGRPQNQFVGFRKSQKVN